MLYLICISLIKLFNKRDKVIVFLDFLIVLSLLVLIYFYLERVIYDNMII